MYNRPTKHGYVGFFDALSCVSKDVILANYYDKEFLLKFEGLEEFRLQFGFDEEFDALMEQDRFSEESFLPEGWRVVPENAEEYDRWLKSLMKYVREQVAAHRKEVACEVRSSTQTEEAH